MHKWRVLFAARRRRGGEVGLEGWRFGVLDGAFTENDKNVNKCK